MAPLDQVDHFIIGPYWRPPFSAAAAGEHPRRPRGPVDTPGHTSASSRLSAMSAPAMSAPLTPPTCAKPLTPPTCAKPSRGYITERKVQARGAADVTNKSLPT